jgi:DDE superfamily endonuclease
MTARLTVAPAPGPLEEFADEFDPLFASYAQRRSFRDYLQGLLLPRDRNKTLTALAGAEPIAQAHAAPVQRLQCFLSESTWSVEAITQRRLELLLSHPTTRPHEGGVLVIDESGIRKDGIKTDHVARQYLGCLGKVDNGIVAVSSLWADESLYYPLHVLPYTPAARLPRGQKSASFRTKPQLAMQLVDAALALGVTFRAVVGDCIYGESEHLEGALATANVPYVLAVRPSKGHWAPEDEAHTPQEAARSLRWEGPETPGEWTPVVRRFRDGSTRRWWAAELTFAHYGPGKVTRLVVATTDPATLPAASTWYLVTNLPAPSSPQQEDWPVAPADLEEVVRLYALRNWVEQSYKQAKQQLGWADFQVRKDRAIRRHWELVSCAFCFCWWEQFRRPARAVAVGEKRRAAPRSSTAPRRAGVAELAQSAAPRPRVVGPVEHARALVAGMEQLAPAPRGGAITGRRAHGSPAEPLSPCLTNYR